MNHRLLPAILILMTTACTVYREYPIEVYQPAEVSVPAEAGNATLIYRNFKYREDTLQHFYKNDQRLVRIKNDPENLDSALVSACLSGLANELRANKTFEEVRVLPYDAFERHRGDQLPEFPRSLLQQISRATQTDILISLETFSSFFSAYPRTYDTPATKEVVTVAVWGVYDPVKEVRLEIKTMIDTVYWNGYDDEGNFQQGYRPPPRLTALELASAMAGKNYAKRFYGTWNTVNRMYSVPPLPDFSNAAYYFEEGKLDKAVELWQKYADDRNGKMAIDARYNLALAYEMKDDLVAAQKWLGNARSLAERYRSKEYLRMITAYQKVLEERIQLLY